MKEMVASSLIGYLLGCFQTSIFISRIFKKTDIREHGSGNAGASNTTVILGLPYGLLTALFDILKAVVAIIIVRNLYPNTQFLPVLTGVATIIGHIFPVFFGFKGGKGVAPLIGTVLALDPLLGLIVVLISLGVALLTDYVVAGSTTIYILFVLMLFFGSYPQAAILLAIGLLVIALIKHRSNYRRILNKEELKIRASFSNDKTEQ